MRAYQKRLSEIWDLGAQLVAILPQTPDNSLTIAEKNDLEFEVLSDVGNKVVADYGLVITLPEMIQGFYCSPGIDLARHNGDDSMRLPIPGTYVLDEDATVRLAFVDTDYRRRLEPERSSMR